MAPKEKGKERKEEFKIDCGNKDGEYLKMHTLTVYIL